MWDKRSERLGLNLFPTLNRHPLKEGVRPTPAGIVKGCSKLMHGQLFVCSKTVAAFLAAACIIVIFLQAWGTVSKYL